MLLGEVLGVSDFRRLVLGGRGRMVRLLDGSWSGRRALWLGRFSDVLGSRLVRSPLGSRVRGYRLAFVRSAVPGRRIVFVWVPGFVVGMFRDRSFREAHLSALDEVLSRPF